MKYFVLSFFVFISFSLSGESPYFYRYGKKISFEKDLEELSLTGKIFVKLKEGTSLEKLEKLFKKYALKEFKRFKYLRNWVLVETTENPVKTASLMVEKNDFSAAEPSFSIQIEKFSILPDDPYFSNQWYLESETKNHAHVISAWESISEMGKIPGEGISVAVIDDGFDIYHEDLEGRFKNWEDLGSASKTDLYNPSVDKHGTACAGIIGASADNGKGTAGVCHSCSLIGVRYDSFQQIDHMAISAIDKAAEMGADIISCSWGVPQSETAANPSFGQPVRELLENIYKEARNGKGSLIIFAAGNDDYDFSTNNGFAANRHVLAVGATDSEGIRSNYSNYGSYLDVTAPSTKGINAFHDGIWTTDNYFFEQGQDTSGYNKYNLNNGDSAGKYYDGFSGTSASAPIAAGIAALVLSANPDLSAGELMNLIKNTTDKTGPQEAYDQNGFSPYYGYGRINAKKAVENSFKEEFLKDPDENSEDLPDDESESEENGKDDSDDDTSNENNDEDDQDTESEEDESSDDSNSPDEEKSDSDNNENSSKEKDSSENNNGEYEKDENSGCSIIFMSLRREK